MSIPFASDPKVIKGPPIENDPFVIKLLAHAPLNGDDLKALGRVLDHNLIVKKGQDIVVQGFECNRLDIIESGFGIRYTLLHKGGRQIIDMLLPGDIVGFPEAFFDRAIFSAMAVTEMRLHRISFDALIALCNERPNIAIALIWFSARESAIYAHHLVDAGRRAPLERVAHFILEMHFRLKAAGCASENALEIPLSQEGIGDVAGLSAPHVNRMLGELKREGLIAIKGHAITILDRAALEIVADFDPSYLVHTSIQRHQAKGSSRA